LDFLHSLFVWANLPYAIVFTVAILFALLQMTGVLGLLAGGSDHDADADADHDIDAEHDVDADADADGDHDADADADDSSLGDRFLVDLGVGRIPFSILWQTFAVTFGISGLAVNAIVLGRALSTSSLAWSIPLSLFIAYLVTRTTSRLLGRVIGGADQEATSRHGLIGQTGVVISSRVTDEFGEIRAKDPAGNFVHVVCRIRDGETPIPLGREVVIVDYDPDAGRLFVAPLDDDAPAGPKIRVAAKAVAKESKNEAAAEIEAAAEAEVGESKAK
jgi:hypothetical protein